MERQLIITADDFGYSDHRNQGIVESYVAGAITRTSLMVNAEASQSAAQSAIKHSIPLGLHLNLTEGYPVSSRQNVQTLVTTEGVMLGKTGFRTAVLNGKLNLAQIKEEIQAQIRKFHDLCGHSPLYVDGHNHAHVIPGLSEVFAAVLYEHGIRETRLPVEPGVEHCSWMEPIRGDFTRSVINDAKHAAVVFDKTGIRYTNGFVGMVTMGSNMTYDRLTSRILEHFTKIRGCSEKCANNTTSCSSAQGSQTLLYCDKSASCEHSHHHDIDAKHDASGVDTLPDDSHYQCNTVIGKTNWSAEKNECVKSSSHDDDSKLFADANHTMEHPGGNGFRVVTVELMAHPGYPSVPSDRGCGTGADEFACSAERKHELDVLTSRKILDWYKKQNISLVSHL